MRVLREDRMRRGSVLSDTVGKTSLFVKGIIEKYGQGEKYVFDPVSFVYLLPTAAPTEEETPKRDEERAREYVLREKETVRLITNSVRSREFAVHLKERAVMPSPQELLWRKAGKEQTICQVRELVQKCREFERELLQMQDASKEMAQSPDKPESQSAAQDSGRRKEKSLNQNSDRRKERSQEPDLDPTEIFRIGRDMEREEGEQAAIGRFHEEIEGLEKNLVLWQETGVSRDAFYQAKTARSVERLLKERRILEQELEYRLFDQVRLLCAEHVQREAVESADAHEGQAEYTGAGESTVRTEGPDSGRDSEERERFRERLTQVWQFLTGWEEPGEGSYAEEPESGKPVAKSLEETLQLLGEHPEMTTEQFEEGQTLTHIRQDDPESMGILKELREKIQKGHLSEAQGEITEAYQGGRPENIKSPEQVRKDEIRKEEITRFIRSRQEEILRIGEGEILRGGPEHRRVYLLSLILRESDADIASIETLTKRLQENAGFAAADVLEKAAAGQTFDLLWQTASQMRPGELEQALKRLEEGQTLTHIRQDNPESVGLLEELRERIQKGSPSEVQGKSSEGYQGEHPEQDTDIERLGEGQPLTHIPQDNPESIKSPEQIRKEEIRKKKITRFIRSGQEEILRMGEEEIQRAVPELQRAYLLSAILREFDESMSGIETLTERLQESEGTGAVDALTEAATGQTFKLLWQTASQMRPGELEQALKRLGEGENLTHIWQAAPEMKGLLAARETMELLEELRRESQKASLKKDRQESEAQEKFLRELVETSPGDTLGRKQAMWEAMDRAGTLLEKKHQMQWFSGLLKETDPSRLAESLEIREIKQILHEIELLEELPQEFPERLLEVQRRLAGGMSLKEIDRAEARLEERCPAGTERERWVQKILLRIRSERLRQYAEQDFRRLLQVTDDRRHESFPGTFWSEVSENIGITTLIGRLNPQETGRLETWMRKWKGAPGVIARAERLLAGKLSPAERENAERPAAAQTYDRDRGGNSVKGLRSERLIQDIRISRMLEHFSGLTVSEDSVKLGRIGLAPETADSGSDRRLFPDGNLGMGQFREEAVSPTPKNRFLRADDGGTDESGYAAVDWELLPENGRESGAVKPQESGAGEIRNLRSLVVRQDSVKQEQTRQQERQESQRQLLMQLQNQNRQQEDAIRIMEKRQEELQTQLKEPKLTWEELEKRVIERLQGQLRMERMRRGLL